MITTREELNKIKTATLQKIAIRIGLEGGEYTGNSVTHVMVCGDTGCTTSGAQKLMARFHEVLDREGLGESIDVVNTGCFGLCAQGPIVVIHPQGTFYCKVTEEDVEEIVTSHLKGGVPVERLRHPEMQGTSGGNYADKIGFYKKQRRIALQNCGVISPFSIEEYIAMDGYQALAKCVLRMTPQDVIDEIKASGLRGRGGAGFPTGMKWQFAAKSEGPVKYVACNADEGDPGAFMDRSVLEGDPHCIVEAMAIAGYAIGASHGFIYVRAEYPACVKKLNKAIADAREMGFLGEHIFGTDFCFDLELRLGAGAFVCGEETALMYSIMGNRGEPQPRPPFPAVKGIFGKPTVLNNVETYANITKIINRGAEWFSSIGSEKSKGTKVFALGGKIRNTGLVEVPMGTTLREIVYEIGGGIPGDKAFKAAQTGGPSGGCIPASNLDIPIDYDSLMSIGTMMGSGGLIVMDEDNCMVDIAKFFLEFTVDESCGKCPPCRIGTKRMLEILNKITSGRGEPEDLERLETLAMSIKDGALCGLGQTAPNPVLSTLRYFRDEYEAHINEKICPAGVCKALAQIVIDPIKCKGCGLCAKNCPHGAIDGEKGKPHTINLDACQGCGLCIAHCNFHAISKK